MTAVQFVAQLIEVAPTLDNLKALGLTSAEATSVQEGYTAKPKAAPQPVPGDELLQLIAAYDCSTLGFSMLAFRYNALETKAYTQVGNLEADLLVIDKATGEIQIHDANKPDAIIYPCANNGASFFDAMIMVETYRIKALTDEELYLSDEIRKTTAEACAEKAGGNRYAGFYLMTLGCDEE